jgi:hypothetical protein
MAICAMSRTAPGVAVLESRSSAFTQLASHITQSSSVQNGSSFASATPLSETMMAIAIAIKILRVPIILGVAQ